MKTIRYLLRKVGRPSRYWLLLALRSPFEALNTLLSAWWLGAIFGAVQIGSQRALYAAIGWMSLGTVLLFLYNGSVWTVYATYIIRFIRRLRSMLFQHVAHLSMQTIDARPVGDWFTRLNGDVKLVHSLLSEHFQLPFIAVSMLGFSVSTLMLGLDNLTLLGLVLVFILPHALISQLVIARPMKALSTHLQELTADNASSIHALVACAAPIRVYQAEDWMLSRFETDSRAIWRAGMAIHLRGALGRSLMFVMGLGGYLVALWAGSLLITRGELDFPRLVALLQYRGGIIAGVMMLLNSLMSINVTLVGAERVKDILAGDDK